MHLVISTIKLQEKKNNLNHYYYSEFLMTIIKKFEKIS